MRQAIRVLSPPVWRVSAALRQARRLGEYTDLILTLSAHRLSVRYRQSILGWAWAILQPLAMMLVFTAVFSRLVRVPSDGIPYALFAYAGLLAWTYFSNSVSNATGSLVSHAALVTKVYFPREILLISYVVAAAADLVIGSTALLGLAAWYHVPATAALLCVPGIVLCLGACALAITLVLSTIHVRFRDVGMALPIALQLMMFASPVVYPLSAVPARWRALYVLNPLAGFIEAFRRAVLGLAIDTHSLAIAVGVTLLSLPAAYVLFKHAETTLADNV